MGSTERWKVLANYWKCEAESLGNKLNETIYPDYELSVRDLANINAYALEMGIRMTRKEFEGLRKEPKYPRKRHASKAKDVLNTPGLSKPHPDRGLAILDWRKFGGV